MFLYGGRRDGAMTIARRVPDDPASFFNVPPHAWIIRHEIQDRERHVLRGNRLLHTVAEIAIAQPHLLAPEPMLDLRTRVIAFDVLTTSNSQRDKGGDGLLRQLPSGALAQQFSAPVGIDGPGCKVRGQALGSKAVAGHDPVGAGKDDPPDPMLLSSTEHIQSEIDVVLLNRLPRGCRVGISRQMDYDIHVLELPHPSV